MVVSRKPDCAVRLLALLVANADNDSDVVRGTLMDGPGVSALPTALYIGGVRKMLIAMSL